MLNIILESIDELSDEGFELLMESLDDEEYEYVMSAIEDSYLESINELSDEEYEIFMESLDDEEYEYIMSAMEVTYKDGPTLDNRFQNDNGYQRMIKKGYIDHRANKAAKKPILATKRKREKIASDTRAKLEKENKERHNANVEEYKRRQLANNIPNASFDPNAERRMRVRQVRGNVVNGMDFPSEDYNAYYGKTTKDYVNNQRGFNRDVIYKNQKDKHKRWETAYLTEHDRKRGENRELKYTPTKKYVR